VKRTENAVLSGSTVTASAVSQCHSLQNMPGMLAEFAVGGLASVLAEVLTLPQDTLKVRLQLEGANGERACVLRR
jgi:Mitochondrial carrier protein